MAYAAGKLYVADTNNHAIRTIELSGSHKVSTLEIAGLTPPKPPKAEAKPHFPDAEHVNLAPVTVKPEDKAVKLQVVLTLPAGYKINPLAPLRYVVESADKQGPFNRESFGKLVSVEKPSSTFEIVLPLDEASGSEKLTVSLGYYYCQNGSEGVCKVGSVAWTLPLTVSATATETEAKLTYKVP